MPTPDTDPQIGQVFSDASDLYKAGELEKVVALYTAALHISPDFVPALVRRGLVLIEIDEYESAAQDIERALELDPLYGLAYFGRGWLKGLRGDSEGELADGRHGLELDPPNAHLYYRRIGTALLFMKQYDEALAYFNQSLDLSPNQPGTVYNRGMCYAQMGKYPEAMADFNYALELDPDWSWALHWRGWVYFQLGETERAMIDYTHAIRFDSKDDVAYLWRGEAYQRLGQAEKALPDFEKALQCTHSPHIRDQAQGWLKRLVKT